MMGIENFATFLIAGIMLNLTPGQDTMYILGRSVSQGHKAGLFSALGIATGSIVHTITAAAGLSAIIMSSSLLFQLIKYAGAAYLVYLGIQAFISKETLNLVKISYPNGLNLCGIYRKGIITNVLNPKVAIFYLAFLPHFIDPAYPYIFIPFILLGVAFTITGTIWCIVIAYASSFFASTLQTNPKASQWIRKASGALFIGLGLKVALEKN